MEKEVNLRIPDNKTLHILYMCIIEHWAMPEYKIELSKDEFTTLESLRNKLDKYNREIYSLDDKIDLLLPLTIFDLLVLIKAFRIGFIELGDDFSTLVGGYSTQDAERVLGLLKSNLPERLYKTV